MANPTESKKERRASNHILFIGFTEKTEVGNSNFHRVGKFLFHEVGNSGFREVGIFLFPHMGEKTFQEVGKYP